jgi:hypothetical protein
MRELLRLAGRDLSLRRFLGYGLGERLPAHLTVSEAHSRRFVDARVFEQAFQRTIALCAEHGLLDGSHLSVDAFHAEADAALKSLRASLALGARAAAASVGAGGSALRADAEAAKLECDLEVANRSRFEAARQTGPAAPPRPPRPGRGRPEGPLRGRLPGRERGWL